MVNRFRFSVNLKHFPECDWILSPAEYLALM